MKDKRNRQKMFIKIFSVFAAIVLWLFVSYTEDDLMDVNIKSIEVQYIGERELMSKGLMVIDKQSVPNASVKIRGRRSDLISVMGGVSARVDLSKIDAEGTHDVSPVFDIPSSAVYISKKNTQSIKLNVAKIAEKTVDVVVVQENNSKNKTFLVESVAEVQEMKIFGEKNDIENVDCAYLYVDVSAVLEAEELMVKPVFETSDRKMVAFQNDVSTQMSEIKVNNNIYHKKTVDVNVELPKMDSHKYSVSMVSQNFDKIEVGVTDADQDFDEITVDFDDVEVIEQGKQKYLLELEVPNGIYLPENNRFIEVEIDVEKYLERITNTQEAE